MGVDITGYSGLTKLTPGQLTNRRVWRAYVNPDFKERAPEIEHLATYTFETEALGPSRSYGGYGNWREELAKLCGYPERPDEGFGHTHAAGAFAATEGPLWELINFADNEGVIGAAVCRKLAEDFKALAPKIDAHPDDYFRLGCEQMRAAIECAADRGALDFG